jgi:hypothetical protein
MNRERGLGFQVLVNVVVSVFSSSSPSSSFRDLPLGSWPGRRCSMSGKGGNKAVGKAAGVNNAFRRGWDKEEFVEKAKQRQEKVIWASGCRK